MARGHTSMARDTQPAAFRPRCRPATGPEPCAPTGSTWPVLSSRGRPAAESCAVGRQYPAGPQLGVDRWRSRTQSADQARDGQARQQEAPEHTGPFGQVLPLGVRLGHDLETGEGADDGRRGLAHIHAGQDLAPLLGFLQQAEDGHAGLLVGGLRRDGEGRLFDGEAHTGAQYRVGLESPGELHGQVDDGLELHRLVGNRQGLAVRCHQGERDGFLGREVVVERTAGETGSGEDVVGARGVVAALVEHLRSSLQDRLPRPLTAFLLSHARSSP